MPIDSVPKHLNFFWWNVESFAHFVPQQKALARWPESAAAYVEKCHRVDSVLSRATEQHGRPAVVGLAEVTWEAAHQLRDRLFLGYNVCSLDLFTNDPEFQVAILYDGSLDFRESPPLAAPSMSRRTRPMAVVDFQQGRDTIRFIACHWTARMGVNRGEKERERLASFLAEQIYEYVHQAPPDERHHVVVMGDLNNEPFEGHFEEWHSFARNRPRATQPEHYTDQDVRRIRMYNCAWRWLGEQWTHSHSEPLLPSIAGTYFSEETKNWHTFDQILVTGGLLTQEFPVLAEEYVCRFIDPALFDQGGQLRKFDWNGGRPYGVSDHVPLVGRIFYRQEK